MRQARQRAIYKRKVEPLRVEILAHPLEHRLTFLMPRIADGTKKIPIPWHAPAILRRPMPLARQAHGPSLPELPEISFSTKLVSASTVSQ
jgi:hypothetical protein